ncbi:MAG: ABC transporter permease [Rickettsiales bacterium]|nr:ABC transporter permease [Rickettsiales bacterium]
MNYIALRMLMGDTAKYIGIIFGITFAALIMTQQPSIFVGLMTRTYSFISDTSYPDLWITDPKVRYVDDIKPMQDTKLLRVRGVDGIKWAVPLYKGMLKVKIADGSFQNSIIIGLDDATLIGAPAEILKGNLADLRKADAVIINNEGAEKLGRKAKDGTIIPADVGDVLEINDKRAVIVGIAKTIRPFQSQPMVYTTYSRATNFAPAERLKLSFIIAGLKEGANLTKVKAQIQNNVGLMAYTAEEFKDLTFNYFMKNTGIPINFGIAVLLGFLVGTAIAGQMFYNFTHDNIKQFGALKAMGTSNMQLVKMIVLQASLAGVTGWGLGVGLASLFGYLMTGSVLAFKMIWQVPALSATGVVIIVIVASLISMIKVIRLEPAIVFK